MKITKTGISSVTLIILAFIIGVSTQSGFSLGDEIFWGLGISPWSNGKFGIHYTIIVSLILLIIGGVIAKKEVPPRRIGVLILFLIVLSPFIVSSLIKPMYFKMHSGLGAIEYEYKRSHFDIRSSADNKKLDITGHIILTNYAKNPLKIGIKLPSNGQIQQEWLSNDLILTEKDGFKETGIFILPPGKRRFISTFSTVPSKKGTFESGRISGPTLILFNDNESIQVGNSS